MPRNLSIIMPNGRTDYWFTDRVFAVGERLERATESPGSSGAPGPLETASTCPSRCARPARRPTNALTLFLERLFDPYRVDVLDLGRAGSRGHR